MSLFSSLDQDYYTQWSSSFDSSHIDSYVYDDFRYSLVLKFSDGSRYLYTGVPPSVYLRLEMAQSKGKFLYYTLRNNYSCTKLEAQ